ncbi:MAG: DUF4097 family beta strand repeat-containing protein [Acidobacteriota bacterium]
MEESTPTQQMPQAGAAPTARQLQPDTTPVYAEPQPIYISPPPIPAPARYPPPPPASKRGPWTMIIAIISAGLLVAVIMGVFLVVRTVKRRVQFNGGNPPPAFERALQGTELIDGAAQTIPLDANSRFFIEGTNGSISIEVWDQPQAQIKLVKSGGSLRDRQVSKAAYTFEGGILSVREGNIRGGVEFRYEIKLPRNLRGVNVEGKNTRVLLSGINGAVSVETTNGEISLSGLKGDIDASSLNGRVSISSVTGQIKVETTNGEVYILGLRGSASVKTTNGDARVVFDGVTGDETMRFESTNGDIELEFNEMFDADLDAETRRGDISVDGDFGIEVQNNRDEQRAIGRIGKGGRSLLIRNSSGDIRITGRLLPPETPAPPDAPAPPSPPKPPAPPESKGKPKGNQ